MTVSSQLGVAAEFANPPGTVRGHVVVYQGRGDSAAHYRRLAARLAVDGYATEVPVQAPESTEEAAAAWNALAADWNTDLPLLAIGADTGAGFLADASAHGLLGPAPRGIVLAGLASDAQVIAAQDDLALRSACPVHRGVVESSTSGDLPTSPIRPLWPESAPPVPILVIHGHDDAITPIHAARDLLSGWAVELSVVASGLHDVLNDVHHRSVSAEIITFAERLRLDPQAAPILQRELLA